MRGDQVAQVLEKARVGRPRIFGLVDQRLELPRERLERGGVRGLGALRLPFRIARPVISGGWHSHRTGEKDGDEEPAQHGTPPVRLHGLDVPWSSPDFPALSSDCATN